MKKKLIFLCLITFILYILCFPKDAVASAGAGLVLWYTQVLPTLLPFSILSGILIYSNYLQYMTRYLAPVLRLLLPVSENGSFVVLSGFLFGFPMGSKNCAELLKTGRLSKKEADILLVVTNNISPVFISSYILQQQLQEPSLTLISYVVLFLPPLIWGNILLHKEQLKSCSVNRTYDKQHPSYDVSRGSVKKKPASGSQMNFKIIDAGIMNGFETLTRLGGYIMLFSMIASFLQRLPLPTVLRLCITGMTEITTGIHLLGNASLPFCVRYVLAMGFTAFGGLSGIAQTSSMIKDTSLSLKNYCIQKLFLSSVTVILACGVAVIWKL